VRDLPHVALGISKGPGRTAPLSTGGRAHDGAACPLGLGQDDADLLRRADIVGKLDPGSAVTTECRPQSEDHPPGLKEAHLIIGLLRIVPAQRLIERSGPGKIGDAKGHEADALLHQQIIADEPGIAQAPDRLEGWRGMDITQLEKIRSGRGFFAALDQSGGSTPKALAEYGIDESRYASEKEMFDLVHKMRTRVITDPAFTGSRVLAAILFEQTMERDMQGVPTSRYLWADRQVVPFLKVDKGLAAVQSGVQPMKPIDGLGDLLERASRHQIFGTKMRSVIHDADRDGVAAIADQQFEFARRISAAGLVPILEPEVSIDSPRKDQAEILLLDALRERIEALPGDATVMLKLTIPTQPGLYAGLAADPRVLRVLALSGGYSRDQACALLARDTAMIASFSRALLEGLSDQQTDEQFHAQLEASIEEIFAASVHKTPAGG
jgi:fructose-bisphosphate aldolase, class I